MGLLTAFTSDKPAFKKLKEEGCLVTFSVEVPAAKVEEQTHTQLLRIQQRARIPGFRQGKAPLDLVQKQFSENARQEAVDGLLRQFIPEAMKALGIQPIASPSVEDIALKPGKPLELKVQAEVAPKVSPKDYAKIKVTQKSHAPSADDLAKRLEDLRDSNARLEKAAAETVAKNHYVVVDYAVSRDGKPLPGAKGESELVEMGSEQSVEGLVDGLLGVKRGETAEIKVKIDGKDSLMTVTVREIKEKILPPLDAELAKDLGFAELDELKAKLREVMEKEGAAKSEREVHQQIEEALLKSNQFPLPPSLVEAQLEHSLERLRRQLLGNGQWSDKQLEDVRAKMRPQAENEVRMSYLLSAIADKEKLEATDDDIKAELEKGLAEAKSDKQKRELEKTFQERRDAIAGMIRDRKTFNFIKEKSIITKES